jgi:hypothetical protein
MIVNLGEITSQFYNEDERQQKIKEAAPLISEIISQVGSFISDLQAKGYRLIIFHIDPERGKLHAALLYCCGQRKNHIVNEEIRQIVESTLIAKTYYSKIIWEDLLLINKGEKK